MQWQDGEQIQGALESVFNRILSGRMRDIPVLNPALSVRALGFDRFGEDWLGVLVTPWFMNLLLLPGTDSPWRPLTPGCKFERSFPYGCFEFTAAHDPQLGFYAMCSLFSPMFQFEDQAAAQAAAHAALQGLLSDPAPRAISRRDLLRAHIGEAE